jgi:hypothetical protein
MKYAVEMGSGAMIYIPNFIKIGSAIQKFIRGETQTHRQHGDLISLLLFFQNMKSRLNRLLLVNTENRGYKTNYSNRLHSLVLGRKNIIIHGLY